MARKNTLEYPLALAQSMSANYTTAVTDVRNLDNCSYQISFTTTSSIGSFAVEASNDYDLNEITNVQTSAGTWAELPLGGTPTANAANDVIIINLNQLPFKAIRLRYTSSTPGTGVMAIKLVCKQLGG